MPTFWDRLPLLAVRLRSHFLPKRTWVYVSKRGFSFVRLTRHWHVWDGGYVAWLRDDLEACEELLFTTVWRSPEMKRRDTVEPDGGNRYLASLDGLVEHHPSLTEFMTDGRWEDGSNREGPSLTVFCRAGEWRASVRDRAQGLVLWASATTWPDLLRTLDMMVLDPKGPWRHDDGGPNNGKRVPRASK